MLACEQKDFVYDCRRPKPSDRNGSDKIMGKSLHFWGNFQNLSIEKNWISVFGEKFQTLPIEKKRISIFGENFRTCLYGKIKFEFFGYKLKFCINWKNFNFLKKITNFFVKNLHFPEKNCSFWVNFEFSRKIGIF